MYNFSTETLFYYVSSCYSWPQITPRCDKSLKILSHGRDTTDYKSYYGLNSAASVWKVILTYSSVVFLNKHFSCRLRQENSKINSIHCIHMIFYFGTCQSLFASIADWLATGNNLWKTTFARSHSQTLVICGASMFLVQFYMHKLWLPRKLYILRTMQRSLSSFVESRIVDAKLSQFNRVS
jgi:hypothetical protein